ncbi:hypothetical protein [Desulfopila sp. IMCC35008]|uniref:hypothetical protein n=1 Tax=Desulfopila sp. IMCC35008 TaxID=2653858 RepID=UPI0013D568BC|nr:hypothetical protein [Desulfopila sp. IMCC35008]
MKNVDDYVANEWYVVRHSGEIPEIAFHSSLHYLTESSDGPNLTLKDQQAQVLKEAAAERYREIVLRDLQHENCSSSSYRGIRRSIVNYHRYTEFCRRQQLEDPGFAGEVAANLMLFLAVEQVRVKKQGKDSVVNCSFEELSCFARVLGLVEDDLPCHLGRLCRDRS